MSGRARMLPFPTGHASRHPADPAAQRQPEPFTTLELVAISTLMRNSVYPHDRAMYEAFRSAHQKINDALGVP